MCVCVDVYVTFDSSIESLLHVDRLWSVLKSTTNPPFNRHELEIIVVCMTVYVYAIDDDKYEAICQFVLKIRAEINYKFRIKQHSFKHTQDEVQYRSHWNSRMHTLALITTTFK